MRCVVVTDSNLVETWHCGVNTMVWKTSNVLFILPVHVSHNFVKVITNIILTMHKQQIYEE